MPSTTVRRRRSPLAGTKRPWRSLSASEKFASAGLLTLVSLGALLAALGFVVAAHILTGLLIMWLVGLATGGAVSLSLLQGTAISGLATLVALFIQSARKRS